MDTTIDEAKKMKVDELKSVLKSFGASLSGKKAELLERVEALIHERTKVADNTDTSKPAAESEVNNITGVPVAEDSASLAVDSDNLAAKPQTSKYHESIEAIHSDIKSHDSEVLKPQIEVNKAECSSPEEKASPSKPILQSILDSDDADELVDYSDDLDAQPTSLEDSQVANDPIDVEPFQASDEAGSNQRPSTTPASRLLDEQLMKERELKYKLLAMKVRKVRSNESAEPKIVHPPVNEPSSHVRIDYFQRPFTFKGLHQWLEETCDMSFPESSLWLNSIKTHCYIDFSSVEEASRCIDAVNGKIYPPTSTTILAADYTTISVTQAPTSEEARSKPDEWKAASSATKSSTHEATSSSSVGKPSASVGNKTLAPASGMLGMMKKAAQVAADSALKPPSVGRTVDVVTVDRESRKRPAPEPSPTSEIEKRIEKNRRVEESSPEDDSSEADVSLDTLFRKTTALPSIYWLPVSDEIVAQRKLSKQQSLSASTTDSNNK
jgi:apoptotic chromatin condensation inducer in the nucleus